MEFCYKEGPQLSLKQKATVTSFRRCLASLSRAHVLWAFPGLHTQLWQPRQNLLPEAPRYVGCCAGAGCRSSAESWASANLTMATAAASTGSDPPPAKQRIKRSKLPPDPSSTLLQGIFLTVPPKGAAGPAKLLPGNTQSPMTGPLGMGQDVSYRLDATIPARMGLSDNRANTVSACDWQCWRPAATLGVVRS